MNAKRAMAFVREPASVGRVSAILGPTNTGKTHFAIERMLAHKSGMIGLPLRLLAREVYDKVVRIKGAKYAALITGEEKIVPPEARYFVCTVESMPLDLGVSFMAVDEIQLCADPERGHVFTDRLLNARGDDETLFMGAETMRGAIQRFVPRAWFITRPRFSDLAYTGHKKLTRLPRRSAVVAFSAEDVYGIADLIRRQRGGAAVVLGALSPRTRNAQVELYQSGDVDFLVATDAIGMGLNMDVDHVAFASLDKFDGVGMRPLRPEELGQIAGRAGRHMNDGTFGVTGEAEPLDEEIVARVEAHRYDPVRVLQYRNSALDFHSLDGLLASLDEPAPMRGLMKARPAMDFISLRVLSGDDEIRALARSTPDVKRLWEACQLPDFRKLTPDEHVKLLRAIYLHLMSDAGTLPGDWLQAQIARLDIVEGDVATLSGRLAQIRTWAYATHRPGWVEDAPRWQEFTRAVEDRLSDALHERLTQRFIDRRTSVLMQKLRDDDFLDLQIDEAGSVGIGGEAIGKLEGFRFTPDARAEGIHGKTLRAAALKGLEREFATRAQRLIDAADKDITLSEHGNLWWDGAIAAKLAAGATPLQPAVQLLADDQLRGDTRERVQKRLDDWFAQRITARLAPLFALQTAADAKAGTPNALPAEARGLAYQLCEHFGSLDRHHATLPPDERAAIRALRPLGVKFARRSIYLPQLLRPDAAALLALLWGVQNRLEKIPPPPQPGITSFEADREMPQGFLEAAGFRVIARRAVRLDMLERLEDELGAAATKGETADAALTKLVSLLGSDRPATEAVIAKLGWRRVEVAGDVPVTVWRKGGAPKKPPRGRHKPKPKPREEPANPNSPFANLRAMMAAK
ncbi:MAG TPA: helicase-related protein [Rhizomicrobium sp.]|jgi:ATP-dependent RNA helicase SUPV3L1/SUV3|nr:helicase-related protein [Rhizomicrobium sp.]